MHGGMKKMLRVPAFSLRPAVATSYPSGLIRASPSLYLPDTHRKPSHLHSDLGDGVPRRLEGPKMAREIGGAGALDLPKSHADSKKVVPLPHQGLWPQISRLRIACR